MLELWIASSLYAFYGITVEVVFTGVWNKLVHKEKLEGHVSLLMFPVYFFAYFIFSDSYRFLVNRFDLGIFLSATLIVILIYTIEYFSGRLFYYFGARPWYYDHSVNLLGGFFIR